MKVGRLESLRSKRGGVLKSAVALALFVAAGGTLGWMLLVPGVMTAKIELRTGFPVSADFFSCNPMGFTLWGESMTVENPSEFGGGSPMLEVRRLKADASLPAIGRGEIRVDRLEIVLSRAKLVRDERGRLNLEVFLERLFEAREGEAPKPFHAERVRLVIDDIDFVDYAQPLPQSRSIRAALDVTLRDLQEARDVFGPIFELGERVGAFAAIE